MARALPRSFYARSALEVAPELLHKVLMTDVGGVRRSARIVEVEAYVGEGIDPASHAYRGETPRTRVMFGPPGHLYVYFTYGMHWCCNAVCARPGQGEAVLLRAGIPLAGHEAIRAARGEGPSERDLLRGPARLCQGLGIGPGAGGADLVRGAVRILDDGTDPPAAPATGPRVGIRVGTDLPWRFWVPDSPFVSAGAGRSRS